MLPHSKGSGTRGKPVSEPLGAGKRVADHERPPNRAPHAISRSSLGQQRATVIIFGSLIVVASFVVYPDLAVLATVAVFAVAALFAERPWRAYRSAPTLEFAPMAGTLDRSRRRLFKSRRCQPIGEMYSGAVFAAKPLCW